MRSLWKDDGKDKDTEQGMFTEGVTIRYRLRSSGLQSHLYRSGLGLVRETRQLRDDLRWADIPREKALAERVGLIAIQVFQS